MSLPVKCAGFGTMPRIEQILKAHISSDFTDWNVIHLQIAQL